MYASPFRLHPACRSHDCPASRQTSNPSRSPTSQFADASQTLYSSAKRSTASTHPALFPHFLRRITWHTCDATDSARSLRRGGHGLSTDSSNASHFIPFFAAPQSLYSSSRPQIG